MFPPSSATLLCNNDVHLTDLGMSLTKIRVAFVHLEVQFAFSCLCQSVKCDLPSVAWVITSSVF